MTIMVDELQRWPTRNRCFRAGSCHLTVDGPLDELHEFARRLGLRKAWFQNHPLAPHYDLTITKREQALSLGAVFVPGREQARKRMAARAAALTTEAT